MEMFLLKSVSTVMDRCSFEQDRRNNFRMMYTGGFPVYVVWKLFRCGVMPPCCRECIDVSGGFPASPGGTDKGLGLVEKWKIFCRK